MFKFGAKKFNKFKKGNTLSKDDFASELSRELTLIEKTENINPIEVAIINLQINLKIDMITAKDLTDLADAIVVTPLYCLTKFGQKDEMLLLDSGKGEKLVALFTTIDRTEAARLQHNDFANSYIYPRQSQDILNSIDTNYGIIINPYHKFVTFNFDKEKTDGLRNAINKLSKKSEITPVFDPVKSTHELMDLLQVAYVEFINQNFLNDPQGTKVLKSAKPVDMLVCEDHARVQLFSAMESDEEKQIILFAMFRNENNIWQMTNLFRSEIKGYKPGVVIPESELPENVRL